MRRLAWVAFMLSLGAAMTARQARARACSLATPIPHVVDPSLRATDHNPPTLPVLPTPTIARGHGPKQDGCATSAMSCDDIGTVSFSAVATDDMIAPEAIGYRLSLSGGALPSGLTLPTDAIEPGAQLRIFISWVDGAADNQEAIDFTLSIVAVDAAGNESTPQTLRVSDNPGCDCAVARPHAFRDGLVYVIAATLLLTTRRRRKRRS